MKIRNLMSTFPGFDGETATGSGGGGAAVAAAPAAVSATAAVSAPATPAAAPKPGMFDIKPVALKPIEKKPVAADGAAAAKPAEIVLAGTEPAVAATTTAPAVVNPDGTFVKPILGRIKSYQEADEQIRRSQDEGLRLHTENKSLKEAHAKDIADREAMVTSLKAELEIARTTPAFKELSKEELTELVKSDPLAAQEYLVEKRFRDRDAKASKEQLEAKTRERQAEQTRTLKAIEDLDSEMASKPDEYPQYGEMQTVMQQLAEKTKVGKFSPLTGHAWTPQVLYLAAMGHSYLQSLKAGGAAQTEAATVAAQTAAADAASGRAAAGDGGGSGAAVTEDADTKEHSDWKTKVLAAAPRRMFQK